MKKFLKDYRFIAIILGLIITLITSICLCFIDKSLYFTIGLVSNISVNFVVGSIILLSNLSTKNKFLSILAYLIITQIFLCLDLFVIEKNLDLNIYTNLMYLTNVQLYLAIYSVFVFAMSLLSGYALIKNITTNNK